MNLLNYQWTKGILYHFWHQQFCSQIFRPTTPERGLCFISDSSQLLWPTNSPYKQLEYCVGKYPGTSCLKCLTLNPVLISLQLCLFWDSKRFLQKIFFLFVADFKEERVNSTRTTRRGMTDVIISKDTTEWSVCEVITLRSCKRQNTMKKWPHPLPQWQDTCLSFSFNHRSSCISVWKTCHKNLSIFFSFVTNGPDISKCLPWDLFRNFIYFLCPIFLALCMCAYKCVFIHL